jgi:minichromosome maintenance protein 10
MSTDTAWPPPSARAALLSSPSGRRKLEERRRLNGYGISPTKSPRQRNALYGGEDSEEDEDEETLKLKLAQIEAKLKLKKLQQSKQKNQENDRPISAIEVPLSPTKRSIPQVEPRSPGRVLLGIDKGIRGADVSLGRARTGAGSPLKSRSTAYDDRPMPRPSSYSSARSAISASSTVQTSVKSFSERMADIRDKEKVQDSKRDLLQKKRMIAGFKVNEAELESYKKAAEEASKHNPPRSTGQRPPTEFSRADILAAQQASSSRLSKSRSTPNLRRSPSRVRSPVREPARPTSSGSQGDAALYEGFSGVHLTTRILPHSFLKRTLPTEDFSILTVPDLLRQVTSPAYELPDSIGSCAVVGVVASKSSPLNQKTYGEDKSKGTNDWEKKWEDGSQNQKRFMVFELTDLKWRINLYLFGTALPRYHRLTPGTVVAVLNPGIMPPKKGKEDTGTFSLTLNSSDDTVLEIGTARDLGFCNAIKKDGQKCGDWVDSSKTEICEFHLSQQIARTQSKRMGVNTGSNEMREKNRIGAHAKNGTHDRAMGTGLTKEGHQFDKNTGSHYYIASSTAGNANTRGTAPRHYGDRKAAHLLDLDDDDPFLAEGQLARDDKAGRLRKHLARMEQEQKISRILGADGTGGAGGEYMRKRAGIESGAEKMEKTSIQRTAAEAKINIMGNGGANKKRTAQEVRLSPAKKTRFITDRGIKVAGRESLPAKDAGMEDDDDDLDIV